MSTQLVSQLGDDRKQHRLFADLRTAIESNQLRRGDKIRSIRELSGSYGLPFESIRQVLRRLEEAKLVQRKHGSGTYVTGLPAAEELRNQHQRAVAMLFDTQGHVFSKIADELTRLLQEKNHPALRFAGDAAQPHRPPAIMLEVVRQWMESPPRAVIVNWYDQALNKALDGLRQSAGSRMIALEDTAIAGRGWHLVQSDVEAQAQIAVDYLQARGHRRIGLITHSRHIQPDQPQTWRKQTTGHTPLILAMGHELRRTGKRGQLTIFYNKPPTDGHKDAVTWEPNLVRMSQWLSRPDRPTAIIGSDYVLTAIIKVARRLGLRMPEDLDLLGIGDTPWSEAYGFSSINLNEALIAQRIADLVWMDDAQLGGCAHRISIPPLLHERNITI